MDRGEERFLLRIVVRTPTGGFGECYTTMMSWLDENCGIDSWLITQAGTYGVCNDAIAIHVSNPTCALAFINHWCLPGDPPGQYELR